MLEKKEEENTSRLMKLLILIVTKIGEY